MTDESRIIRDYSIKGPDARKDQLHQFLNKPEMQAKVNEIAADFSRILGTININDIKMGARFKDKFSGGLFEYIALSVPYKADLLTLAVMEVCKKPMTEYIRPCYMIFHETIVAKDKVTPIAKRHTLFSVPDFLKVMALRFEILSWGVDRGQPDDHEDLAAYMTELNYPIIGSN